MKTWLRNLWRWYWEPFAPDQHSIREQSRIFLRKAYAMFVFASLWVIIVFFGVSILHFIIRKQ